MKFTKLSKWSTKTKLVSLLVAVIAMGVLSYFSTRTYKALEPIDPNIPGYVYNTDGEVYYEGAYEDPTVEDVKSLMCDSNAFYSVASAVEANSRKIGMVKDIQHATMELMKSNLVYYIYQNNKDNEIMSYIKNIDKNQNCSWLPDGGGNDCEELKQFIEYQWSLARQSKSTAIGQAAQITPVMPQIGDNQASMGRQVSDIPANIEEFVITVPLVMNPTLNNIVDRGVTIKVSSVGSSVADTSVTKNCQYKWLGFLNQALGEWRSTVSSYLSYKYEVSFAYNNMLAGNITLKPTFYDHIQSDIIKASSGKY